MCLEKQSWPTALKQFSHCQEHFEFGALDVHLHDRKVRQSYERTQISNPNGTRYDPVVSGQPRPLTPECLCELKTSSGMSATNESARGTHTDRGTRQVPGPVQHSVLRQLDEALRIWLNGQHPSVLRSFRRQDRIPAYEGTQIQNDRPPLNEFKEKTGGKGLVRLRGSAIAKEELPGTRVLHSEVRRACVESVRPHPTNAKPVAATAQAPCRYSSTG